MSDRHSRKVRWHSLASLTASLVLASASPEAQERKTDPAYLGTLPAVERVEAEIQGTDETDTAARHAAAFWILRRVVGVMSDGREGRDALTADEQGVIRYYTGARNRIIDRFDPLPAAQRNAFYGPMSRNENNVEFRLEVLRRFVQPGIANRYLDGIAADGPRLEGADGYQGFNGWFEGLPFTRRLFFIQAILAIVLVLFAIARERRPFGFEPGEKLKLRAGWRGRAELSQHDWETPEFKDRSALAGQNNGSPVKEVSLTVTTEILTPAGEKLESANLHLQFEGAAPHLDFVTLTAFAGYDSEHPPVLTLKDQDGRSLYENFRPAHRFLAPWSWPALVLGWGLFSLCMTGLLGQDETLIKGMVMGGAGFIVGLFLQARARKRRFTAFEQTLEQLDASYLVASRKRQAAAREKAAQ